MKLRPAIAAKAAEDVAGQALGVRAEEHRLLGIDLAQHQGEVVLVPEHVLVRVQLPLTRFVAADRYHRLDAARDQLFVATPVRDHLLDGDDLDVVLAREAVQVRHS